MRRRRRRPRGALFNTARQRGKLLESRGSEPGPSTGLINNSTSELSSAQGVRPGQYP